MVGPIALRSPGVELRRRLENCRTAEELTACRATAEAHSMDAPNLAGAFALAELRVAMLGVL